MTYEINGVRYIVTCVGGSDDFGMGDYVMAFALYRSAQR